MNNQEKFTPGPWVIDRSRFNSDTASASGFCSIFNQEDWCVATVEDAPHFAANAHLIAQSPNLYHALDESTQCMEIMLESLERNGYDTSGIEVQLEKNKAVISAALGEWK